MKPLSLLSPSEAPARPLWARYTFAVCAVALAAWLRWELTPFWGRTDRAFLFFVAAMVGAAWYGRLGPGVLAVGLSAIAIRYLFIEPRFTWYTADSAVWSALAAQSVVGLLLVWAVTWMHREHQRVERSKRQFHAMAENVPVLIWISNTEKRCTWFNRRWLEFTGRTLEQDVGNGWAENVHPDDLAHCLQAFHDAFDARQPFTMEYRLRRHDGAWRWVLDQGTPLHDAQQAFTGYVGSCIDITEQRLSVAALRESEERERARAAELQTIMESVPALIWIARDAACEVVTGNPASYQLLRLPPNVNASKSARVTEEPLRFEVFANGRQLAHHELPVQRAARGESVRDFEEEVRFEDGTARVLFGNAETLRDAEGRPRGAVAAFVDITERKQAEQQLAEVLRRQQVLYEFLERRHRADTFEELYEAALDSIISALRCDRASILLYDDAGVMRFVRWRHLSDGYRRAVEGHSPWRPDEKNPTPVGVSDVRAEIAQEELRTTILSEGIAALAFIPLVASDRLVGKFMTYYNAPHAFTREEFELSLTIAGQVALAFERMRASEALRQARDEAVRANRAKDEFIAMLSHELRTPLNPAMLIATACSEDPTLPAQVRADFATIAGSVALEARLIDDLLDLNRIARGKVTLQRAPTDVAATILDAVHTIQEEIAAKHLQVSTTTAADSHLVHGDSVRLRQVFWNVLKNAVKFTPNGGTIEITTARDQDTLVVQVTDSGVGMSSSELARAFEPFTQGDHATNAREPHGGLGLGLAISRTLVERHGGTIEAASEGLNRGTCVIIRLPLLSESAIVREQPTLLIGNTSPDSSSAFPSHGARNRVLLVEDHTPTRTTLTQLLRKRDYQVVAAGSVAEARTRAAQETFDLLISDLGLPDGDGCALINELRQSHPQLNGIALSGYGMDLDLARTRAAGFSEHLVKPVTIASLERALQLARRETSAHTDGRS